MKTYVLYFLFFGIIGNIFAQQAPISTAFPFLRLSGDAVASGAGDIGVASSADTFSQYWNSSKYVFAEQKSGVGMGYTPYLNRLVKDIFLGNIVYYQKTERSAWAGSLRYFSIGSVTLTKDFGTEAYVLGDFRPAEFSLDVSYNLKLSEHFAMGVAARYLRSNLRLPTEEKSTGSGFAVDISGYYSSKQHLFFENYLASYTLGFQIANIGQKIKYDDLGKEFFIPTNLKLGAGYHISFDSYNTVSFLFEANKLLVPSPPKYGFDDLNNNGQQDIDEPTIIIAGKDPDVGFLKGIFQSFSDAPDGFKEELQEIAWGLGVAYSFNEQLFLRTGYFNENKRKGYRQYATIGTGFRVSTWQIDLSYLFSFSETPNPLSSSLRLSLQYNF